MNRLYIGILSLWLAIHLSIFGFYGLHKMHNQLTSEYQAMQVAVEKGNQKDMQKHLQNISRIYEKNRTLLGVLVNENELKEIDVAILELQEVPQNSKEALEISQEFIAGLKEVYASEKINLRNIL